MTDVNDYATKLVTAIPVMSAAAKHLEAAGYSLPEISDVFLLMSTQFGLLVAGSEGTATVLSDLAARIRTGAKVHDLAASFQARERSPGNFH